jgi:PAS domain S-box-containing protein
MNILDIRTVLISYFISNAICAVVMLYLWRNNRKRSPEIGYWLADFILQFLAIFLILLRSNISPFVSIILANAFVIGGTILLFIGLEKYMGMVNPRYPNYILLGVFLLTHTYFTYANESLQARNINASVALLLLCAQCAWLLLRRVGIESRQATRLPGIIFAIYSAVIVTRIILDSTIPQSNDLFKSGLYDTLVLLTYQMLFIALTFSLFLMVNRKLFGELENDIILRKTAQEGLKASEEKFSSAFQNSPDAIILSSLESGQIIEANECFYRLSEYTRDECANKTTIDLNLWESGIDRVRFVEKLKQSTRVINFETKFRKKSGVLFPGWISSEVMSINDSNYVISVIHDLTEKKETDNQISELSRFPEENPSPVLRIDSTGKILYANPASREIIDYWQSLYSDGVPVFWGNSINEASTMHHTVEIVEDFNGKTFSFILSPSPNAGVLNVYGRDVTEKIKASRELELERNKLKSILDRMNDGVYIVNKEYDIEYVNPVLIREFGHPGEKKCYEYFNDLENPCEWCKNREVFSGDSIQWEWFSPKNGKTFSIFETPINNPDGTTSKMEVFHDITELKKAEQELRESEDKFRVIFERSTVGKSLTAPDGKLIKVNEAFPAMLGYTIEEFQDINFADITYMDDLPASREVVRSILANENERFRFEKRYLHKDGSIIWADVSTSLLRDDYGNPLYLMTSLIDITERKKLEEEILKLNENLEAIVKVRTTQLLESNKELESFSYSVSHDLRAPLRALDGFSLAILEDYSDKLDAEGIKHLNRIREASQKMANLIDAMLTLSRVTKANLNSKQINLSEIAGIISSDLGNLDPKRKVTWNIQPGIMVNADPVLIKNVMENLLVNAWKFTSKHASASIEVGTLKENDEVVYFVQDDGAGFDMNYATKLFGAFQRVHSSAEFEGTGIGLATVQRIITKHGGRIWAEGKPEGGATFYFTLNKA